CGSVIVHLYGSASLCASVKLLCDVVIYHYIINIPLLLLLQEFALCTLNDLMSFFNVHYSSSPVITSSSVISSRLAFICCSSCLFNSCIVFCVSAICLSNNLTASFSALFTLLVFMFNISWLIVLEKRLSSSVCLCVLPAGSYASCICCATISTAKLTNCTLSVS